MSTERAGDHNVTDLLEAIAARVPDRDALISGIDGARRLTWADLTDRARRLASVLTGAGIGLRADPTGMEPWESPHDHVALYLYNGNEYLEGMIGAWGARTSAINVNYRYVATELAHILRDSRARAIIVDRRFAPTLAEVLPDLPDLELILEVGADPDTEPHAPDRTGTTGVPALPGAVPYEAALAAAVPRAPADLSPDDRYILYTGGTTGMPKGVLWRQGDFLATCLGVSGSREELVAAATKPSRADLRTLPAAPLMHGAALWNAFSALVAGGTVVIPGDPTRLDPVDILTTCERERVSGLQIVGDAFARPLLEERRRGSYDLSSMGYVLSGGAVLSPPVKAALVEEIPGLRIIDVLGSSETGRQAIGGSGAPSFAPGRDAAVLSDDRSRRLEPGDGEVGWLAQQGRVPLGYLGDPDKTRATFPVIDGVRYSVAGDRVRLTAGGEIELLGRESAVVNTGGEKVFAEEVEQVLTSHPAVGDALVVGRPSPRWGQEVVAVVAPAAGAGEPDLTVRPTDAELRDHCRDRLAGYKLPKAVVWVDRVERSPSGKPDYAWAREVVARQTTG